MAKTVHAARQESVKRDYYFVFLWRYFTHLKYIFTVRQNVYHAVKLLSLFQSG